MLKQATNGSFLNITIYYQVIKSLVRRPIQYEGVMIIFSFTCRPRHSQVNINQEPDILRLFLLF